MTRKNYKEAAALIKTYPEDQQALLVKAFEKFFANDNWRFNSASFYIECGFETLTTPGKKI